MDRRMDRSMGWGHGRAIYFQQWWSSTSFGNIKFNLIACGFRIYGVWRAKKNQCDATEITESLVVDDDDDDGDSVDDKLTSQVGRPYFCYRFIFSISLVCCVLSAVCRERLVPIFMCDAIHEYCIIIASHRIASLEQMWHGKQHTESEDRHITAHYVAQNIIKQRAPIRHSTHNSWLNCQLDVAASQI